MNLRSSGSIMFRRRSLISMVWCACHSSQAFFETSLKIFSPLGPGYGGRSRPGSSCWYLRQNTVRDMETLLLTDWLGDGLRRRSDQLLDLTEQLADRRGQSQAVGLAQVIPDLPRFGHAGRRCYPYQQWLYVQLRLAEGVRQRLQGLLLLDAPTEAGQKILQLAMVVQLGRAPEPATESGIRPPLQPDLAVGIDQQRHHALAHR